MPTVINDSIGRVDLQIATGDFGWSGTAEIIDIAMFLDLEVADSIRIQLGTEIFNMVINQKTLSRDGDLIPKMSIGLISPTSSLASPIARTICRSWDAPVMAREAAEAVAGTAINWGIVDWSIPGGALAFTDTTPMEIIRTIVTAAGGIVLTDPDGSLRVQPKFPVSVPLWNSVYPAFTLRDAEHNLSIQESDTPIVRVNRVLVRGVIPNESTGQFLSAEVDANHRNITGGMALVNVYSAPLVGNFVVTSTVGSVTNRGVVTKEHSEDLHFNQSKSATLSKPASSITSTVWIGTNLGNLTLGQDKITMSTAASGNGVARVNYRSNPMQYGINLPMTMNGLREYPVQVQVTATSNDGDAGNAETYLRGDGEFSGVDVIDPILTSSAVRRARGISEIDAGESLREVTLGCIHIPNLRIGHMVEVHDSFFASTWRGQVIGINHTAEHPIMSTSLRIIKHV